MQRTCMHVYNHCMGRYNKTHAGVQRFLTILYGQSGKFVKQKRTPGEISVWVFVCSRRFAIIVFLFIQGNVVLFHLICFSSFRGFYVFFGARNARNACDVCLLVRAMRATFIVA